MSADIYRVVIDQWCAATGMQPWPTDSDINIEIDGATVALIYDEQNAPQALHIMADLGPVDRQDMWRYLLELNIEIEPERVGYFALHPAHGNAVLRIDVALSQDLDGGQLPERIGAAVAYARSRLFS